MFNKGLDKEEKLEGLFKRLKNIEDKTDNQLKAIEDQRNKQIDFINEIDKRNRKSIGIYNEVLMELEKEIKDKKNEIRKKKRSKNKDDKDKAIFNYTASDGTEFDFTEDIKLLNFPEDLYKRELTFNEAEKGQEEMIKINDLKKRIKPRTGPKPLKKI